MTTTRRNLVKISGLAALLGRGAFAQDPAPKREMEIAIQKAVIAGAGEHTFEFMSSEFAFAGKLVKGVPYSAEATSETVQSLPDGNRIVRKNKSTLYRDSEGRTRNEQNLAAIGPWAAEGQPRAIIFITDPVAGASYVLSPSDRTARKIAIPQLQSGVNVMIATRATRREGQHAGEMHTIIEKALGSQSKSAQSKTESLGNRTIEGLLAEGTRTVTTIPAGELGNERPIEIVSERWYSPELQVVVLTKRTDPRMGETTYRLSNVNRTEPPRSLFDVPADYTIKEGDSIQIRKKEPRQ